MQKESEILKYVYYLFITYVFWSSVYLGFENIAPESAHSSRMFKLYGLCMFIYMAKLLTDYFCSPKNKEKRVDTFFYKFLIVTALNIVIISIYDYSLGIRVLTQIPNLIGI